MIHKKRKKNASFRFYSHTQGQFRPFPACFGLFPACFGLIRPISGLFRPYRQYRPPADTSDMADTARFWPNQPDSARIEADSAQIEPHRCESSRVGVNSRKKKKQMRTDAQATASDTASHVAPHWTQVPRSCFLETKYHSYLSKKKKKKTITPGVHKKPMKVKCNNLTKKSQKTMLISN